MGKGREEVNIQQSTQLKNREKRNGKTELVLRKFLISANKILPFLNLLFHTHKIRNSNKKKTHYITFKFQFSEKPPHKFIIFSHEKQSPCPPPPPPIRRSTATLSSSPSNPTLAGTLTV